MRHISANCWLYVLILPRLSTTRTPSAVDSRVARSSDSDFRWSTSAGPRLRPFLISLPFLLLGFGIVSGFRARASTSRSEALQLFALRSIRTPRTSPELKHEAAQHRTRSARSRIGCPVFPRHLGPAGGRRAQRNKLSPGHGRRPVRGLGCAGKRTRRGRSHFLRLEARARENPRARRRRGGAARPLARL